VLYRGDVNEQQKEKKMKKLFVLLAVVFFAFPAFAQEETPTYNIAYTLELGDGDSIIVFGDGNTIYVPTPEDDDPMTCTINTATYKEDLEGWIFDIGATDLIFDGVFEPWSRLILYLGDDDTWTIVWGEQ
jgi:hypothetical protein